MTITIPPVVRLTDIGCTFGSVSAIKSVSLEIQRGEVVGLVGENGAGKSTIIKILAGIIPPSKGRIEINGIICSFRGPKDAFKAGIGVVHQEQSLFTNLTVAENIDQHRSGADWMSRIGLQRWSRVNRDATAALQKVGVKLDPKTYVRELSFIDRQMVEIARAVCIDPAVGGTPLVVLDEPTAILEPEETAVLEREIRNLKQFASVIFISHRLDEVLRICDRVIVMRSGEFILDKPSKDVTREELFSAMAGRHSQESQKGHARSPKADVAAIEVRELTRRGQYRNVSFAALPGQIVALVGSNGSGSDSVMRAMFGAEPHDGGEIKVDGRRVAGWSIPRAVKAGLAYVPAERKIEGMIGGFSAAHNVAMVHPGEAAIGPIRLPHLRRKVAQSWFNRLDVHPNNVVQPLVYFSGGNQQKVVLAKWLNSKHMKVFLLDHPLRGLDAGASETVNAQIRQACDSGAAVVLIPDTIEEALDLADKIIVLRDGEVSARYDMTIDSNLSVQDVLEKMV